jgi:hypothetical protein
MSARHSVVNHLCVFDLDQIFSRWNRDSYVNRVIRASSPASFGGNAMREGFPDTVAVGLGIAFAFALSFLVLVAFAGLH